MEVLRTPDERFANLAGYPFAPHYVDIEGFASITSTKGRALRRRCSYCMANRRGHSCTAR